MVLVAAIIGALNLQIALLLFTTTILLGILVSVSSVFISEFDRAMYGPKDVLRLLGMAIIENFGIRQVISLWRMTGYFSAMRKSKGWGAQVRKGFGVKVTGPKAKS
jgi:peptidoglycan-N-acetylglucosamine deacetylase